MLLCLGPFAFVLLGVCLGFSRKVLSCALFSPFMLIWSVRCLVRLRCLFLLVSFIERGVVFSTEGGFGWLCPWVQVPRWERLVLRSLYLCSFYEDLVCLHGTGGRILEIKFSFCFIYLRDAPCVWRAAFLGSDCGRRFYPSIGVLGFLFGSRECFDSRWAFSLILLCFFLIFLFV